ncbi:MAG: hypothetical protein ACRDPC_19135 [Solirubrobacteraceae bacterium]
MTPRVRVVRDLSDAPATTRYLNRLHCPARGVVVVRPTPGHGGSGIARDILTALGKRFRAGSPRAPERLIPLAGTWLRAERIRHLIIIKADRRPAAEWSTLRDLCAGADAPALSLIIHRSQLAADEHAALGGTRHSELSVDELSRWLQPAPQPDAERLGELREVPPVPDVDFPFFPSACAELLPAPAAQIAIDTFTEGRRLTFHWLGVHRRARQREIVGYLDSLIAPCASPDAALSLLRGAQAALLTCGLLARIDPHLVAARHRTRRAAPTPDTARRLRAVLEPHLAAAAAIVALTGRDAESIAELRLRDIQRDGAALAGGHVIPPHLQALICAQLLVRQADGATTEEPLFLARDGGPASPQAIGGWLARVAHDTDLNVATGYGIHSGSDRAGWATVIDLRHRATAIAHRAR